MRRRQADFLGRDIEGGVAGDGAAAGILRLEEDERVLAEVETDAALQGPEGPGQAGGGIGVEQDRDFARGLGGGVGGDALGGAVGAGGLAEQAVEGDRVGGERGHAGEGEGEAADGEEGAGFHGGWEIGVVGGLGNGGGGHLKGSPGQSNGRLALAGRPNRQL